MVDLLVSRDRNRGCTCIGVAALYRGGRVSLHKHGKHSFAHEESGFSSNRDPERSASYPSNNASHRKREADREGQQERERERERKSAQL